MSAEDIVAHALAYPFGLRENSYLLFEGQTYPILEFSRQPLGDTLLEAGGRRVPLRDLAPAADKLDWHHFLPILASGSNAAPDQLQRKLGHRLGSLILPVLRARVSNICSVYSAHLAPYGSVPATLHWVEGALTDLNCLFVPEILMDDLHASEALDLSYGFYEVRSSRIAVQGCDIETCYAYISLRGNLSIEGAPVRLPAFRYQGPRIQPMTEKQLFERLLPELAPAMSLRDFIAGVIRDAEFRDSQSEALHARFSSDNRSAHFIRIE